VTWLLERPWSPLRIRVIAAIILLSVAAGFFAAFFPRMAILAIAGMAFLAVLGYFRSFMLSGILFCGTVTILRDISFGPVSGMAILTIYLMVGSWCLWLAYGRWTRTILLTLSPFLLFIGWGFVTLLWTPASAVGLQNLLVMATFVGFILLGAEQSRRSETFQRELLSITVNATWLAGAIYLATRFAYGVDIEVGIGARGFALLALMGTSCALAQWRYRSRRDLGSAAGIVALIGFSLSRMATVVGILLFPLSRWSPANAGGWVRLAAWNAAAATALFVLITRVDALRSRFVEGDMALNVGGVPVNAMGRTRFWETTLKSHQDALWLGKGAGSSEQLIADIFGISHPHNDYLRILHDFGRIGMALWAVAFVVLLGFALYGWVTADRARNPDAATHLAAFLGLIAVALTMVTDNVIVYVFVMAPLGALVGASLGRSALYRSEEWHGDQPQTIEGGRPGTHGTR
jgi:O-antigen ligase